MTLDVVRKSSETHISRGLWGLFCSGVMATRASLLKSVSRIYPKGSGQSIHSLHSALTRVGAVLLLIGSTNFAVAAFSADQIRAGVTEAQLRAAVDADGNVLKAGEGTSPWWVYRKSNNDIVATYHLCRGKVYQQAIAATGGIAAYLKRVAQFNRQFGKGQVSVESAMESEGERIMLEFFWRREDEGITASYFAASSPVSEAQWLSTAVPSVCGK